MAVMLRLLLLLCIFCGVVIGTRVAPAFEESSNHVYEVYAPDLSSPEKLIYAKSFTKKATPNKNYEVKKTKESNVMEKLGYVITIAFSILFYPFVFPVLLAIFTFLKSFFIANVVKIITFSFASIVIFCNATSYCNAYGWGGKPVEDEVRGIMKSFVADKSDDNLLSYLVNEAIEKHNRKNKNVASNYAWN